MINNLIEWYGKPLILASASPRRKQNLEIAGIEFSVHVSNYHEPEDEHTKPEQLVQTHAKSKAQDVAQNYNNAWIVGADTVVVRNSKILGKPKDSAEARNMLQLLSGKTHQVYTGYCVLNSDNQNRFTDVAMTEVTFHHLPLEVIDYYINNYKPFDKAGSYGIQDFSAVFVENISGCFYNVVGFPIAHFMQNCFKKLNTLV